MVRKSYAGHNFTKLITDYVLSVFEFLLVFLVCSVIDFAGSDGTKAFAERHYAWNKSFYHRPKS